jgi:hypothetical protein
VASVVNRELARGAPLEREGVASERVHARRTGPDLQTQTVLDRLRLRVTRDRHPAVSGDA